MSDENRGNENQGNNVEYPQDVTINIEELIASEDGEDRIRQKLRNLRCPATVIFFDLVGSTGYRRKHGLENGLKKSHTHNIIVSRCIVNHGGHVVKWLGDGVMGIFHGEVNKQGHSYRACLAALDALEKFREKNQQYLDPEWEQRYNTKVGISTGMVHFITIHGKSLGANEGAVVPKDLPLTFCDPIGTAVDLAARLESFAEKDVILIDKATFFDIDPETHAAPICLGNEDPIKWRRLRWENRRSRMHHPHSAAFCCEHEGLRFVPIEEITEPAKIKTFQQAVDDQIKNLQQAAEDEGEDPKKFVYASNLIKCNVAGFSDAVEAIAVSLEPLEAPVKEKPHASPSSDTIKTLLKEADELYRTGDENGARVKYEFVLQQDPRDFYANVWLAQYYRRKNDEQVKEAVRYWKAAKGANPKHPLTWALAGITHLENSLKDIPKEKSEEEKAKELLEKLCELKKAIEDFDRATELAGDTFDSSLEQYCSCMHAISCFVHRYFIYVYSQFARIDIELSRAANEHLDTAHKIAREVDRWPAIGAITQVLKNLVKTFYLVTAETDARLDEVQESLQDAKEWLNDSLTMQNEQEQRVAQNGQLLDDKRLNCLIDIADTQLTMLKHLGIKLGRIDIPDE